MNKKKLVRGASIILMVLAMNAVVCAPVLGVQAQNPIVVEYMFEVTTKDPDLITIHLSERLTLPTDPEAIVGDRPGARARLIEQDLLKIKGIRSIFFEPYTIQVYKGGVFSLERLEPEILKILKNRLAPSGELKKVSRS